MRLRGGEVTLEAVPDRMTSFTLRFPGADAARSRAHGDNWKFIGWEWAETRVVCCGNGAWPRTRAGAAR